MLIDEKRGIEEAYSSATNTSDLRVEADVRGDADIIIAAGWSQNRIGAALLRLHTDWDRAEKPARLGADGIARLAEQIRRDDQHALAEAQRAGQAYVPSAKSATARAHDQAHRWYVQEVTNLIGKLQALPAVYTQVVLQLVRWGYEDAEGKAAAVIRWWLSPKCPSCNGTKLQVVEGTGRQSGKLCKPCGGSGDRQIPHGQEGRRMANFMDQCVERARGQIGNRLRPERNCA